MSALGRLHTVLAAAALVSGAAVLLRRKGTGLRHPRRHPLLADGAAEGRELPFAAAGERLAGEPR